MIRGIESVISPADVVAGRFYLEPVNNSQSRLLQHIQIDGLDDIKAVLFTPDESPVMSLEGFSGHVPLIALPPVSVRVDPPSVARASGYSTLHAGTLIVSGSSAFAVVALNFRQSILIDLQTGRPPQQSPRHWVAFSNWFLVVDEAGEEIPIASFGSTD